MSVPTLLALAGTALMAVAIFVPFRSSRGDITVAEPERRPHWPELVEPTATACDVSARLDLVDALASIDSPWAVAILDHARVDETDPAVSSAIAAALAASSCQSLVT